jgi:hypothetical protein
LQIITILSTADPTRIIYRRAFNQEFYQRERPHSKHINALKFDGITNNNRMERINSEIRDREKVMRGLKRVDTKILPGMQIYHNFVRGHEALKGMTPAEACGIVVEGENKWMTLIQNASQEARAK